MVDVRSQPITREKLARALGSNHELVRLLENLVLDVRATLPTYTDTEIALVEAALNAHIANPTGAHKASAVSVTPSSAITSTDVQAALQELAVYANRTLYGRRFLLMGG